MQGGVGGAVRGGSGGELSKDVASPGTWLLASPDPMGNPGRQVA